MSGNNESNKGLSHCECCGQLAHSYHLLQVSGVLPYPEIPATLCRSCNEILADLEMRFRAPQTMGHIRAAAALR